MKFVHDIGGRPSWVRPRRPGDPKGVLPRREFLKSSCAAVLAGGLAAMPASPVTEFRRGGMTYRRLGRTDLYPSLLSFGAHTDRAYAVRTKYGSGLNEEGQKRRERQLAHAFDLGVNLVDVYETTGQLEPTARVVRPRRDKILVMFTHQGEIPECVGDNIERRVKLFGHVDLYRFQVGEGQAIEGKVLEDWDVLRKAKEVGKVRAIGICTHEGQTIANAVAELEGLDFIQFPYNFIHGRAGYSEFLPTAIASGVGLIAMKPLASGSIVSLDPRAPLGPKPESARVSLFGSRNRAILPAVVDELTRSLNRLPEETLCQAAMRFVYSAPFLSCALTGMWDDRWIDDNYAALTRQRELSREERAALDAVAHVAKLVGPGWLPPSYQWLDERWGGRWGV